MAPSKSLAPTMTLAQLYESQNQLFDALAVYARLYNERGDEDIQERLEAVQERILSDDKLHYDPRIAALFTADERKRLKILPQDRYEKLQESMQQQEEDEDDLNVESDEELAPEPRKSILEGSYDDDESVSALKSKPLTAIPSTDWLSMNVGELSARAIEILGKNKSLQDITLGELIRVFYGSKE